MTSVLDPFAGSATTLDPAQSLGRRWTGIDIGDDAIKTIESRLRDRHGMLLEYETHRNGVKHHDKPIIITSLTSPKGVR